MKKTLAFLCALCMLLSVFSVSVAEEKTTLRVSWWGGEARHAATVEALRIFDAKSEKYVAEAEYCSSGHGDKLLTQLAGNQGPTSPSCPTPASRPTLPTSSACRWIPTLSPVRWTSASLTRLLSTPTRLTA